VWNVYLLIFNYKKQYSTKDNISKMVIIIMEKIIQKESIPFLLLKIVGILKLV